VGVGLLVITKQTHLEVRAVVTALMADQVAALREHRGRVILAVMVTTMLARLNMLAAAVAAKAQRALRQPPVLAGMAALALNGPQVQAPTTQAVVAVTATVVAAQAARAAAVMELLHSVQAQQELQILAAVVVVITLVALVWLLFVTQIHIRQPHQQLALQQSRFLEAGAHTSGLALAASRSKRKTWLTLLN